MNILCTLYLFIINCIIILFSLIKRVFFVSIINKETVSNENLEVIKIYQNRCLEYFVSYYLGDIYPKVRNDLLELEKKNMSLFMRHWKVYSERLFIEI